MIGLGTYTFFWQWHPSAPTPVGWRTMLDKTRDFGCSVFQFCDYAPFHEITSREMGDIARYADALGIQLELGTRGLDAGHLDHYIGFCQQADARVLRSMVKADEIANAEDLIREVLPSLERADVSLSLETYEQIRVPQLVELVHAVDSEHVGICLDPANSVAALDMPAHTIELCAPYVNNLHVKDFAFTRRDGWVGFTYTGTTLGDGLLDYDSMVTRTQAVERGISQIVEHWLIWQGDSESTCRLEDEWTRHSLDYLHNHKKGISEP